MRFTRSFLLLAVLALWPLAAAAAHNLPPLQGPAKPLSAGYLSWTSAAQDDDEQPPAVPHPVTGRVDCLTCHSPGGGADVPEEHEGRTSATCTTCHTVADRTGIPAIPHLTEGREDCLVCHGPGQVNPFPADHQGQTKDTCGGCHQPGAAAAAATSAAPQPTTGATFAGEVPAIPHPTEGREDCLVCHGAGQLKPFPADHQGRTKDTCGGCHQPGAAAAVATSAAPQPTAGATFAGEIPAIPHPTEGREDCVVCHGAGQVNPFPADHQGRTKDTCRGCHQPGAAAAVATSAAPQPTAGATFAGEIPAIPHPTEGREDCLVCHGAGQVNPFPADHQGRTKDTCGGCHQPGAAAAVATSAAPQPTAGATTAGAISAVPHPTEGREDCLVCHGAGQVKPFPANHQGRTKDSCLGCHQASGTAATPAPQVQALPTPIREPEIFGENSCVTCHQGLGGSSAQITADWQESVHAAQGVGCVSCHGGDPTQPDATAAMSPAAGFLGPLPKERIPGLCGSCHSKVDLMRPFDLPTDQLDQYWFSQHGRALLQGDKNVATCFDCHDGHRVLKVQDPASQVYPSNEPAMCARCHADPNLMGPYGIPSDQYALYQTSIHGENLLQHQDLRAPACSTCHGTHGAAPPGYQEVANVCGQCHTVTEQYYLQGAHKAGMTGQAAPACMTCHGRHDVMPPTLDLFRGTEDRHCGMCHAPGSATAATVDAIYQTLKEADDAYAQAEETIARASEARLIMAQQEELLQKANTPLIEAQALQHSVNLGELQAKSKESVDLAKQAQASAEEALRQVDVRRLGMVIALAAILLTIVALVLIKRELDHDLQSERARQRAGSQGRSQG